MEIENNKKNETVLAICSALVNNDDIKANLTCKLSINVDISYKYENIYLLPYFSFYDINDPFDVIISEIMKAEGGGDEPDPTDPDSTDPDTTDPDSTDPDTTDPDTIEPDTTDPDTTDPDTDKQFSSYLSYSLSILFGLTILLF